MYCGCGERLMDSATACSQLLSFIKVRKLESWTATEFMNETHDSKINSRLFQVFNTLKQWNLNFPLVELLESREKQF